MHLLKGMGKQVSAVYGLKGETEKTMENTFRFIERTVEEDPNTIVLASSANPMPGSKLFRDLQNSEAAAEYSGDMKKDDVFDYQELAGLHAKHLARLQAKHCTPITLERILWYRDRTKELVTVPGHATSFGVNKKK